MSHCLGRGLSLEVELGKVMSRPTCILAKILVVLRNYCTANPSHAPSVAKT